MKPSSCRSGVGGTARRRLTDLAPACRDLYGDPWPQRFTGESMGASHVAAWFLTPVTNATLDVNQQVLQNRELLFVSSLARTGNPTADRTPVWDSITPHPDGHGDEDH